MNEIPGGPLAARPLHFIWIADCSGSMGHDAKMETLNQAIREALPHMREVAEANPNAQVLVRALKFSSGAQWHVAQPTPVDQFSWLDLEADGITDMGKGLSMLADVLKIPPMEERALPPVLVLVSDGMPTDDANRGLQTLMQERWAQKAVRMAIAIGQDAQHEILQKFIGHNEIKPLQANSPEALVRYIKWMSTEVVKSTSAPPSRVQDESSTQNVVMPSPPTDPALDDGVEDVW